MKYSEIDSEILKVFGSDLWKAEGIKTYPNNFIAVNAGTEYIRVTPMTTKLGVNHNSAKGIVIIDIFVAYGKGPSRLSEIADKLDAYLQNKSLLFTPGKVVQFFQSTVEHLGADKDNTALYRVKYSIPFNYNNGV